MQYNIIVNRKRNIRKYLLLIICVASFVKIHAQCNWQPIGSDDFTKTSYSAITAGDMVLSNDGTPYIAYADKAFGNRASVMRFNGKDWEPVGARGFSHAVYYYKLQLFIDKTGSLYVFYEENGSLNNGTVMKFDGANWVNVGKPLYNLSSTFDKLITDKNGILYAAFFDSNNNASVMKFNGTEWENVGSGFLPEKVSTISLAIDSSNTPYVLYKANPGGGTRTLKFNGISWDKIGGNVITASTENYNTLKIGSGNIPYLLNQGSQSGSVMKLEGVNWVYVGLEGFIPKTASFGELIINSPNELYVSYWYEKKSYLQKYNGKEWILTAVTDSIQKLVLWKSIMNTDGTCYNLYKDGNHSDNASVIKFDGSKWNLLGHYGVANSSVYYSSLALDKDRMPYIVYSDQNNESKCSVKKFDNGNWISVGKDGLSDGKAVGNNIAIDRNGVPFVIYMDNSKGSEVKVMRYDGNNWIDMNLTNSKGGGEVAITFDRKNIPYIAYYVTPDGYIVKKFENNNWIQVGQVIPSLPRRQATLLFGKSNTPYFSSAGKNADAFVSKFTGTSWVTDYSTGSVGSLSWIGEVAFAIDTSGTSDLCYMAYTVLDNSSNVSGKVNVVRYGSGTIYKGYTISQVSSKNLSMATNNNQNVCVVYSERDNDSKAIAKYFDNNQWVTLGDGNCSPYTAYCNSLKYDDKGNFYLAYCGETLPNFPYSTDDVFVKKFSLYTQPVSDTVCENKTAVFMIDAFEKKWNFHWQQKRNNTWADIQNSSVYSGTSTNKLSISKVADSMNLYQYRCILNNGCTIYDTSNVVTIFVKCNVWPGDADNSRIVNNYDILPIGVYYSQKGTSRAVQSNEWKGFASADWNIFQPDSSDIKHVDCNGDGTINENDTLAVHLNFGLSNSPVSINTISKQGLPELYLKMDSVYYSGQDVTAELWVGTSALGVRNLYGIAFDLKYDTTYIQPNTEKFSYENSWLSLSGNNMLTFSKNVSGMLYGAETRVDHAPVTGYGKIADLKFKLKKSIPDRTKLFFSFTNYKANDNKGDSVFLKTKTDSIIVIPDKTGIIEKSDDFKLTVFPNPFSEQTTLVFNKEIRNAQIEILNLLGQKVKTDTISGSQYILMQENLEAGVYLVQVISKNSFARVRIVVQ